ILSIVCSLLFLRFFFMICRPPRPPLFPYTTLFRSPPSSRSLPPPTGTSCERRGPRGRRGRSPTRHPPARRRVRRRRQPRPCRFDPHPGAFGGEIGRAHV